MKIRKGVWLFAVVGLLAGVALVPGPIHSYFADQVISLGTIYWQNAGASQIIMGTNQTATLTIQEATNPAAETAVVKISSINAGNILSVTNTSHLIVDGALPTASANCAVSAGSTDTAGQVVISGGATSSCVVTFVSAFANTPFCVAADSTTTTSTVQTAPNVANVTLTISTSRNDTLDWLCFGR